MFKKYPGLSLAFALLFFPIHGFSAAEEAGPRSGGGADAAMPPQGPPTIAETYASTKGAINEYDRGAFSLSKELRAELMRAINIYANYANINPLDTKLWNALLSDRRLFIPVEQIPDRPACKKRLNYPHAPAGWAFPQWACTEGWRTFVVTSIFNGSEERPGFTTVDKALGLIHEGLRSLNASDADIINTVLGVQVALENYHRQKHGDFSHALDEKEKDALLKLAESAQMVEKSYDGTEPEYRKFIRSFTILPFGAMVSNKLIENEQKLPSRLGIGTRILRGYEYANTAKEAKIELDESSIYLLTNLCEQARSCKVGANVFIDELKMRPLPNVRFEISIEDGSRVIDSTISADFVQVSRGATLEHVSTQGLREVKIGEIAKLSQVFLYARGVGLHGITVRVGSWVVDPQVTIERLYITDAEFWYWARQDRIQFAGSVIFEPGKSEYMRCAFPNNTVLSRPVTTMIRDASDLKRWCK